MTRLLAAAPGSRGTPGIAGAEPAIPASTGAIDTGSATELLASVGFLLVPGPPQERGDAYLMVALRPSPTVAHYDPERIEYWAINGARPERLVIGWPIQTFDATYAWGCITTGDRFGEVNEFASFGGRLTTAHDGDRHAAIFRSDAPILPVRGRSVSGDSVGILMAGFFGELRAAAGDVTTRDLLAGASPAALYAAFIVHTLARFRARSVAGAPAPRMTALLHSELQRLDRDRAGDVRTGLEVDALM